MGITSGSKLEYLHSHVPVTVIYNFKAFYVLASMVPLGYILDVTNVITPFSNK